MKKLALFSLVFLFAIAGLHSQEGTLDSTFNSVGFVKTNGYYGSNVCMAIQPDGKIVVAGKNSSNHRVVLRYNSNGSLDPTFNGTGIVTTASGNGFSNAHSVLIQSDGKIIVAGAYFDASYHDHVSLIRYNSDGSLDNTFGTGGFVSSIVGSYSDRVGKAVLQSDGKIVVGAYAIDSWTGAYRFTVLRYTSAGVLDATFNSTGYNSVDLGCLNFGNYNMIPVCGVALQSDGKILFSGAYGTSQASRDMVCIRLNSDGSLDSTFNGIAYITKDLSGAEDFANDVAVDNDGKIVLAGKRGNYAAVARYNTDGTIDLSFGTSGSMYFDLGTSSYCKIQQITVLPDDKLLVGGMAYIGSYNIAVARLTGSGTLDNTFGTNGKVNCGFLGSNQADVYGHAIQNDGKIVVAGGYNQAEFAVMRFKQKSFPSVSSYPTASAITYGETLSVSTLSGGSVSVAGTWSFLNPTLVPDAGIISVDVVFTPADPATYTSIPGTVSVVVNTKELTVSGAVASDKVYDGTTDAVISGATLVGVVGTDNVSLSGNTTGVFAQSDTGTAIPVSTSMILTGSDISNYYLTQPVLAANITAKELTVTGVVPSDKVYDGTTDAVLTGSTLQGVVGTDDVVLANASAGVFAQSDTGTAITVSTSMSISGADIANYYLTQPTGFFANIFSRELTVGGTFDVADKPYDGNTSATITANNLYLIDTIAGDTVFLVNVLAEFASSSIGTNIVVSIVSADLSGADSDNYILSLSGAPTTTADILSGVGISDRPNGSFALYPNPATDFVYIMNPKGIPIERSLILTSDGRLVKEVVSDAAGRINISDLAPGLYYLQVFSKDGVGVMPLMVE
ncbi:MAG: T9SS type A sorting domain-containing protein [Bacteroidales bacterium]|nr:T9SS type A sorting domain-containing protein [Bacteroidales bacterium]